MRKNLLGAVFIMALLLFQGWAAPETQGAEWVLYAVSLDGNIEEYYDRGTLGFPAPGIVTVTTRSVKYTCEEGQGKNKGDRGNEDEALSGCAYTITRHRIDCRNRVDIVTSSADYEGNGRLIHQSREPYTIPRPPQRRPPQEIYPESVSENLIHLVCPQVSMRPAEE